MPEGDTVRRTADRLDRALAGQPLHRLELRWGELGGIDLLPATTLAVRSRGKHLLHHLDTGLTVHSHLRMEGSYRLVAAERLGSRGSTDTQIRILAQTKEWAVLGLRLGLVQLWPTDAVERELAYLGPDLLGADWDLQHALNRLLAEPDLPLGEALMDQRKLAGIGTFWAGEGLFLRRMNPWSPVGTGSRAELVELIDTIRTLMLRATATGIQSSTGRGRRGELAYVHARVGRTCLRCGAVIRLAPIGAAPRTRVLCYCPTCQGGMAPTDEGRAQAPLGSAATRGGGRRGGRGPRRPA